MEASLPQLILPIKLERSSERLTSLGGLVVLEELARAVGLWEEADRVLEGPKSGRGYAPHEFVQGFVWSIQPANPCRVGYRRAGIAERGCVQQEWLMRWERAGEQLASGREAVRPGGCAGAS